MVCNNANKYLTTYGLTCDQDVGTGGVADSNGDDNIALLDGWINEVETDAKHDFWLLFFNVSILYYVVFNF